MRSRILTFLLLTACSYKIQGPTPVVTGAVNERDQSTGPAYLCNAQGDPAAGWLVDARGDKFAPLPTGALVHTAGVSMPTVALSGPESYTVPSAYVHFIDQTRMPIAMRTADSAADAHALTPGDYALKVTNLNGASGTAAAAVRVVPPPQITAVALSPAGGAAGTSLCSDQAQTLTITGTGFRTDKMPSVAIGAHTFTASSSTGTTATVDLPAGTFTAAETSGSPTVYTVYLTNPEGCVAPYGSAPQAVAQINAFASCNALGALTLNPRFGWTQKNQAVTISNVFSAPATKGFSGGAPQVTITAPIKGSTTPVSIPLRRVAYLNANTITALVPTCSGLSSTPFSDTSAAGCPNGIAAGGPYTVSVVDPGGAAGALTGAQGFVVVANEPPVIANIKPSAIDTGGTSDLEIDSGGTSGANFAGGTPQIVFPVSGGNLRACTLPFAATAPTASVIHAQVPTSVAQANCVETDPTGALVAATGGFSLSTGLYVIRVQAASPSPAYGDFSGLVVTQPSKKPTAGVPAGASLQTARADFPVVRASDDIGNSYLYALGGIDGPTLTGNALSSIEVAQITEFGTLSSFSLLDRTALGYVGGSGTTAVPRHGLGAVAVAVPGDTSYVFALGGIDASGHAMTNVERAQVLKVADAPVLNSPIATAAAGTLAAGSYYYKVSALLSATDPNNPGGETLASDFEPVSISSASNAKAVLSWPCIANAVKYRVYRTVGANQAAGTERLLVELTRQVSSCTGTPLPAETFTDDGGTVPAGLKPQPAGALGRWVTMPSLPTARGQAAIKLAGDRIFAAGGCTSTSGTPACNGPGGETATIDIATVTGASIGASYGSATLTAARRQGAITVANSSTAPNEFTTAAPDNSKSQWLLVMYGQAAGAILTGGAATDVAQVVDATGADVATPTFANAAYGPSGFGVTGGWAESIADLLLVYGSSNLGTGFDFRVPQGSTTICGGAKCTANTSFSATLTSASVSVANRYLPGETLFRAYVYAAGGLSDATAAGTAQTTVERILY